MVTLIELVAVGKQMRDAQKEYFRTRSSISLAKSKSLEKKFDEMIKEGNVPELVSQQNKLF